MTALDGAGLLWAMQDTNQKKPPDTSAQLVFDVAVRRPDYRRGNFVVTSANEAAFKLALEFLNSDATALVIAGPSGSGKTHLLHILADEAGVQLVLDGRALAGDEADSFLAVDNVEAVPAKALLAFVENARARGRKVALAGAGTPRSWAHGLRDLETRLEAMARVTLEEPDEDLLRAVIDRRFSERQWRVGEGVAGYAAPRIPRTFAAAEAFVAAAGEAAIAERRPVTQGLARMIVARLF